MSQIILSNATGFVLWEERQTNKKKKIQTPPTWIQFSVKMDLLHEEKKTRRFSYTALQVFRKTEGLHRSVYSSFLVGAIELAHATVTCARANRLHYKINY